MSRTHRHDPDSAQLAPIVPLHPPRATEIIVEQSPGKGGYCVKVVWPWASATHWVPGRYAHLQAIQLALEIADPPAQLLQAVRDQLVLCLAASDNRYAKVFVPQAVR